MSILERFVAYAADFEKTLADDDWSRLPQYFSEDAVYRVESDLFGCELKGHDSIFAGMKKSLDGFDRNFSERDLAMTEGPEVEGDEMRVSWTVTYHKSGLPDFVLRGKVPCARSGWQDRAPRRLLRRARRHRGGGLDARDRTEARPVVHLTGLHASIPNALSAQRMHRLLVEPRPSGGSG